MHAGDNMAKCQLGGILKCCKNTYFCSISTQTQDKSVDWQYVVSDFIAQPFITSYEN